MKLLYFAWMREKVGHAEEVLDARPDGVTTVADLIVNLLARGGGYADAFADRSVVRVAVNQSYVDESHVLGDDDEVAFFPPVTGG